MNLSDQQMKTFVKQISDKEKESSQSLGKKVDLDCFKSPNGVKFEKKEYNDPTYKQVAYFMTTLDEWEEEEYVEISKEFYDAASKEFLNNTLYEEAHKVIRRIDAGPYRHNIISLILQDLRNKTNSPIYSNRIIDELNLDFHKAE
jgi:hypothetical protein